MADERDGLTFLPIVKGNTTTKRKHNKRIGFKNIHKPLVLPSLELSTVDVQLVSSLFSHKQICKKVCEWFTGWRSWQQRILLCGVSDKCTKSQLQALVTTLEPVFHRDFTTRLKGIYPTTLIRARSVRTAPVPSFSAEDLMIALQPELTEEIQVPRVNSSNTAAGDTEKLENGDVLSESDSLQISLKDVDIAELDEETIVTKEADPPAFVRESTVLSASAHTVQQALDVEENRRHEHAPPFSRRVSTPNFFPQFDHQQLGLMKTALRTGDTDKLYGNAPVTFKHDKWWEGHKGARLMKPRRSKLSNHFKSQIAQIHQWLDDWQTHERVELLSEVVKSCDEQCLNFFAQCLTQRLRDQTDLNCVPDHVLLNIFSYLNIRSLCQSSQVCHRWRFLANDSTLWKNKITALGASEGVADLPKIIKAIGQGQAVDWKQAYREVQGYYKDLLKLKVEEQEKENTTPYIAVPLKKNMILHNAVPVKKQSIAAEKKRIIQPPKRLSPVQSNECDSKTVISGVVEVQFAHSKEDIGPAQSPTTTELREHGDEFTAADFDGNDLTGGNLKLLTRSLKALARDEDKPEDLDVALDVRPTLIQASNLLEKDGERNKHKFRYLSLAVQGVFAIRRVRRLQGHMDAILCLQFDKRRLITGSADRTIRVWDVRSGRSIHKLRGHKGGVRCLQFDNDKIISGSWDMTVMVWHIVKFHRLKVLYGHTGCVSCLQFNDKFLLTGSHDRTMRIWSTVTWQCESVIQGHEGSIFFPSLGDPGNEVADMFGVDMRFVAKSGQLESFAPLVTTHITPESAVTSLQFNEYYIVSGSVDRTIKLWNLETRECLQTFVGHKDSVLTIKVLGNLVFSGSADGMIMFWDLETGKCQVAIQAHEGPVHSLDFNKHQHIFSAGGDYLLKEWDIGTCTCLRSLQGHKGPVLCVKAVPHRVVSCSADGFTRIWDLDFPDAKGQSKNISIEENIITPHTIQQNSPKKMF